MRPVGWARHRARAPLLPEVAAVAAAGDWSAPLAGGDDYELLFTLAPQLPPSWLRPAPDAGEPIQEIGYMADETGRTLIYPDGRISEDVPDGFDHFKS